MLLSEFPNNGWKLGNTDSLLKRIRSYLATMQQQTAFGV